MSGFFSKRVVTASQKERTCEMCNGKILIGDGYIMNSGKQGKEFFTYNLCVRCDVLLAEHADAFTDEEGCIADLFESLSNSTVFVCPECGSESWDINHMDARNIHGELTCSECDHNFNVELSARNILEHI